MFFYSVEKPPRLSEFDLEIPENLQGQVESGKTIMYWEIMGKRIMKQMVN